MLELKEFLGYLRYVFLANKNTLLVIIADNLVEWKVEALILVLIKYKRAIGWTIPDIIGISLGICTHKIHL